MGAQSASDYGLLSGSLYSTLLIIAFASVAVAVVLLLLRSVAGGFGPAQRLERWSMTKAWHRGTEVHSKVETRLHLSFGVLWVLDGLFQLRPDMPGGFISQVVSPSLQGAPHAVIDIVNPFLNLWSDHPLKVDLTTAWVQILIGLGMILLKGGPGRRAVLWLSVLWSAAIFVVGNGFGVFYSGASFLTGAPGAVLLYGFIGFYLLQHEGGKSWTRKRSALLVPVAVFFAIGGVLQGLPGSTNWQPRGLSSMLSGMALSNQPGVFSWVITVYSHFAASDRISANLIFVVLPILAALVLVRFQSLLWPKIFAGLVALAGWWIGMDFGIYSATATDFNSGLPLILIVWAACTYDGGESKDDGAVTPEDVDVDQLPSLHHPRSGGSVTLLDRPSTAVSTSPRHGTLRFGLSVAALTGFLLSSLIATVSMFGPVSVAMANVDSSGYLAIPPKVAPGFALTSFNGQHVSLSSLRGRPILLTFLDPMCYDTCPLMAQEMVKADSLLGSKANNVALVAVDANPYFTSTSDTRTFSVTHGLANLKNWYYLSGTRAQLAQVWANYGIQVQAQRLGMVVHTQVYYFINKAGIEVGALQDSGNSQYSGSYSSLIETHLKGLL